jgi:hypothetical protein
MLLIVVALEDRPEICSQFLASVTKHVRGITEILVLAHGKEYETLITQFPTARLVGSPEIPPIHTLYTAALYGTKFDRVLLSRDDLVFIADFDTRDTAVLHPRCRLWTSLGLYEALSGVSTCRYSTQIFDRLPRAAVTRPGVVREVPLLK